MNTNFILTNYNNKSIIQLKHNYIMPYVMSVSKTRGHIHSM